MKQIGIAACAIVLIGACGGSNGNDPAPAATSAGEWSSRAALPTARQEMASAVVANRIYTPGGFNSGGQASTVLEIYDVATDRWSTGPALTEARHHPGATAAAGIVYVMAVTPQTARPVPLCLPSIQRRNSGPQGSRCWHRVVHSCVVEHSGKIYAIGGVRNGAAATTNEAYDPATNTWAALAPMPTAREHLAAAAIGDRIYVVGGRAPSNTPALEAYAPATNTWERLPDMPTSRGGLAAAALNGKLYVFGGEIPGVFPHTEEYDPVSAAGGAWRTCPHRATAWAPLPWVMGST